MNDFYQVFLLYGDVGLCLGGLFLACVVFFGIEEFCECLDEFPEFHTLKDTIGIKRLVVLLTVLLILFWPFLFLSGSEGYEE